VIVVSKLKRLLCYDTQHQSQSNEKSLVQFDYEKAVSNYLGTQSNFKSNSAHVHEQVSTMSFVVLRIGNFNDSSNRWFIHPKFALRVSPLSAPQLDQYTILPLPILYGVLHTQGGSDGGRILRIRRAIVLQ